MSNKVYGVTNDEIMDFLKEHMVTKQESDVQFFDFGKKMDEKLDTLRSELIFL